MDRFQQLADQAPDAIVVVDATGTIVYANAETEKLFGYSSVELVGQSHERLIPERFREAHAVHTQRFLAKPVGRPMGYGASTFGLSKDGREIALEVSLGVIHTAEGVLVATIMRDITARQRMEEELKEARRAAEAASAAKSEFLSSMTHELRTPFNAIVGFAQLLYRDKKEPLTPRQRERVDQILKGAEHLLHLVDDVLDLSRIEARGVSMSAEGVDVKDVLGEVMEALAPAAEKAGIHIVLDSLAEDVSTIAADRTRFVQILMNYGMNAIKYTREGGEVRFSVSRPSQERLRMTVSDTGVGIPLEKQDKLFQPFQRAGQETGPIPGTGIGLAICKRLAELMQGNVGFRSAVDAGSEFWVDMPINTAELPITDPRSLRPIGESVASGGKRSRIVYIEDNPANVALMSDLLSDHEGVELLSVPTAEMGIELSLAEQPRAIILDINLPGMNGFEAMEVLRSHPETRNIPVIALTAAASEADRKRGREVGFHAYFTKPGKIGELEETLRNLLGSSG